MTTVYTYTEARQDLASLLDKAAAEGEVQIRRRDGQMFVIRPLEQRAERSPLDVGTVSLNVTTEEIVQFIAEGRGSDRW